MKDHRYAVVARQTLTNLLLVLALALTVAGLALEGARPASATSSTNAGVESVSALTYAVGNLNDSGPGSFRQALLDANAAGGGTIGFDAGLTGTIVLTTALPDLGNVEIEGPGASSLTIQRSTIASTPEFVIFNVPAGVTARLSGLSLSNGRSLGSGGIRNAGTVTIENCNLFGNTSTGSTFPARIDGAAVTNLEGGTMTVTNSNFSNNSGGNAIWNAGTLHLTGGTISRSSSDGLYNEAVLQASQTTISDNANIGVINFRGTADLTGCTISRNYQGVANFSVMNMTRCKVTTNAGLNEGVGILSGSSTTLNLIESTVAGNIGGQNTGARVDGGGIYCHPFSKVNITRSLISGNKTIGAAGSQGGGIYSVSADVNITDSTITGNQATSEGGGIYNQNDDIGVEIFGLHKVSIIGSTITANSASQGGGIYDGAGVPTGGGPGLLGQPASIKNTILANNNAFLSGANIRGTLNSLDHNLIRDAAGSIITGFTEHNLLSVDPRLAPLADNGGPTQTCALRLNSPAIDAGVVDLTTDSDQRGQTRGGDRSDGNNDGTSAPDIGAFEVQKLTVTNLFDSGEGSLRQELLDLNAAHNGLLRFNPGVSGTIDLETPLPNISADDFSIIGPGAANLTLRRSLLDGTPAFRILTIESHATVNISGLTLSNGIAPIDTPSKGGGMALLSGHAFLSDCVISGNSAGPAGFGGGLFTEVDSSLELNSCVISGNEAGNGGGIFNSGTLTTDHCTIAENNARSTGGGGGIFNGGNANMTVLNSAIINNRSSSSGGGVFHNGDSASAIINSTISGNSANGTGKIPINKPMGGGGICTLSTLSVTNSTITSNTAVSVGGGNYTVAVGSASKTQLAGSILAGNSAPSGPDDSGGLVSQDYNLIGNTTGASITGVTDHNLLNVVPRLGPLAQNGGPTQTHALLSDSPALDAGSDVVIGPPLNLQTDQRGLPRGAGLAVDIGAFEAQPENNSPVLASINSFSVAEGQSDRKQISMTVSLSRASESEVAFQYATVDSTATAAEDYLIASDTLRIPAGATSGVITVLINGDTTVEPDETFFVVLSNPSGAELQVGQGQITITNDDVTSGTTLSVSPATGIFGSTVSIAATLASGNSGLTGRTVSFTLNGIAIGSTQTDSNGTATLNNVSLAGINAGTYANGIRADFVGDANFSTATSTSVLEVSKATPSVQTTGGSFPYDGQTHAAEGTVTGAQGEPLGTPTFAYIDANGQSASTAPAQVGTYTVRATYPGSDNYNSVTDDSQSIVIVKAEASIKLSNLAQIYDGAAHAVAASTTPAGLSISLVYSQNGIPVGAPVDAGSYKVLATVNDVNYSGGATATLLIAKAPANIALGQMSYLYDGAPKSVNAITSPAGLSGLSITYEGSPTPPADAGSYAVVASLANANFIAQPATGTLVVGQAQTSTTLASSLDILVAPGLVTFHAEVTTLSATTTKPSGLVEFLDGATALGTAPLSEGSALLDVSALAGQGQPHQITARYLGAGNFSASAAPVLAQTVVASGGGAIVTTQVGASTIKLNLRSVSGSGNLKITPFDPAGINSAGLPQIPRSFGIDGTTLAFNIETTASYNGSIIIAFEVPSVGDPSTFSDLRVLHFDSAAGKWLDQTILPTSPQVAGDLPYLPDFQHRTIYARTASLSPFVLATVLDKTAPTLTVPADMTVNATGPAGASVNFSVSVTDAFDSQPTLNCNPASGSVFPVGITTVICTATDAARNTSAPRSFKVTVKESALDVLARLIAFIDDLNLKRRIERRLDHKLDKVLDALRAGNLRKSCQGLDQFLALVEQSTGKKIEPSEAAQLTATAYRIKKLAGCP